MTAAAQRNVLRSLVEFGEAKQVICIWWTPFAERACFSIQAAERGRARTGRLHLTQMLQSCCCVTFTHHACLHTIAYAAHPTSAHH